MINVAHSIRDFKWMHAVYGWNCLQGGPTADTERGVPGKMDGSESGFKDNNDDHRQQAWRIALHARARPTKLGVVLLPAELVVLTCC